MTLCRIDPGKRLLDASLGEAFGKITDQEAIHYLLEEGLPTVQKARRSELAQLAIG